MVTLSKDMLSGELSEFITDPDLDGVASGAIFGSSLYVNNARYSNFPASPTEYWVTKLNIGCDTLAVFSINTKTEGSFVKCSN